MLVKEKRKKMSSEVRFFLLRKGAKRKTFWSSYNALARSGAGWGGSKWKTDPYLLPAASLSNIIEFLLGRFPSVDLELMAAALGRVVSFSPAMPHACSVSCSIGSTGGE